MSVVPHAGQELELPGFALSWDKQTHVNQMWPVAPAEAYPGNCPGIGTDAAIFLRWFGASREAWGEQRSSGGAAHGNLGRISALPVSSGQILPFGKAL